MILKICEEISKNKKCSGCGASKYDNCICLYCGSKNNNLETLISELIHIIKEKENFTNRELASLFSLKDLNINEVNSILDNCDVNKFLNTKYKWLIENKYGNDMTSENAQIFVALIESNSVSKDIKNFMITVLTRYMIKGKLNVSNDSKKIIIKHLTEMYMEGKVKNPECIFSKLEDANGDNLYSLIRLDERVIDEYLKKGAYAKILMLIFHECTHTYQRYYIKSGEMINYLLLLQTKEIIISNRYKTYYDDNYYLFSQETEARYMEYKGLIDYLDVLKLSLSKEDYDFCKQMMIKEIENTKDENRILNGKITTVDEIFDYIELSVEDLNRYPLLNIEYKIEDGKVVKKDKEELENDYNNYSYNQEIEYLYSKLLGEKLNKKST